MIKYLIFVETKIKKKYLSVSNLTKPHSLCPNVIVTTFIITVKLWYAGINQLTTVLL